ncbi:MAG: insulinase family protein [Clostridiales bacterium]|nr:insulinase family protein [Clostridiales bacterium]
MKTEKLANGLTVVLENLPYSPSASVGVWVRAGAVDEAERAGISHLIEHMMFKGTKNRTYRQISEDLEKLGTSVNAFTTKEATCFYVKSLTSNLVKSVEVIADMVTGSVFDEAELEKEKNVIYEEMKMIEDVPDDFGSDLIQEAVFSGTPLASRIIGSPKSVGAISRDDILGYTKERYSAPGMVIACSGMFDEAELMAALEEGFGCIGEEAALPREYTAGAPARIRDSVIKDIEQSHLFLGTKGVKFTDKDVYALNLYSALLGGGMSSRLFMTVREELGLAYSVYAADSPYVNDGQFTIYAGTSDEKVDEAVAAIKGVLKKLAEDGLAKDELAKVKEQYKASFIFRRESNSSRMFAAGRNMLLLGRIYTEEEIIAGVDAVTADDIARLAAKYADFTDYSAIAISSVEHDLEAMLADRQTTPPAGA